MTKNKVNNLATHVWVKNWKIVRKHQTFGTLKQFHHSNMKLKLIKIYIYIKNINFKKENVQKYASTHHETCPVEKIRTHI